MGNHNNIGGNFMGLGDKMKYLPKDFLSHKGSHGAGGGDENRVAAADAPAAAAGTVSEDLLEKAGELDERLAKPEVEEETVTADESENQG